MKNLILSIALAAIVLSSCEPEENPFAPYIESLSLQGEELYIIGDFGSDPGAANRDVLINGEPLPEMYIISWDGETIISTLPPEPGEIITVEILVNGIKSNPKILTLDNSFHISYLDIYERGSELYIYGNFGDDPGEGKRSVSINGLVITEVNTPIDYYLNSWTPWLIKCTIPITGPNSIGEVVVTKNDTISASRILSEWRDTLYYLRPQGGAGGTLKEEVWFQLRFRADAGPLPANAYFFPDDVLNQDCKAVYSGSGTGNSSYNNIDGCASINVNWNTTSGIVYYFPSEIDMSGETHFQASATHLKEGWDVDIDFDAWKVIPSVVTTTPCVGSSFTEDRSETITFDAFEYETIELRTEGTGFKNGNMSQSGLTSSAGLFWDASEIENNFMTAWLVW